jgi:hypothetical protein
MNFASTLRLTRESHFGTQVPKSLVAFDWHLETTRTICPKGRFRKT